MFDGYKCLLGRKEEFPQERMKIWNMKRTDGKEAGYEVEQIYNRNDDRGGRLYELYADGVWDRRRGN